MQHLNYYFRQTTATISTSTCATGRLLFLGYCAGPGWPLGRPSRAQSPREKPGIQPYSHKVCIPSYLVVPMASQGHWGGLKRRRRPQEPTGGHRSCLPEAI